MPRALRKAQKQKQELELQQAPVAISDEGSDQEVEDTRSAPNPFDLLNAADDQDELDDEEEEQAQLTTKDDELDADEQEDVDAAIEASLSHNKPKRKKKKKNKQKAKQAASVREDDFEAALQAHQSAVAGTTADPTLPAPFHLANLLSIDVKLLDPAAEMRQFFGSKVVHSEQQERQATIRRQLPRGLNIPSQRGRKSVLVPIDDNWPAQIRGGLEMVSLGEDDGIRLFRFQHPKAYAEQQLRFLEAVGSGDPQVLLNLLGSAPFHVDTLLQASEIFRHQGNHEESGEMLARALYAFDRALHPLFKIAKGMVRLPFEIPENRSFYLCIYRYIQSLGRRGLWQTAFEYNKLLYALAPEEDPYAALLSLDYYALKAKRFDYVAKLAEAPWEAILDDNTSRPGMLYSRALSKWLIRPKRPVDAAREAEAMALMQQAAQAYPAIPAALFAAASAQGPVQWQQVSCTHMQAMHRDLFVFRHKDIYGIPENLAFLRSALLEQDPPLESTHNDDSGMALHIRRHILLLDERSLLGYLPKSTMSILSFDPLRPADSVPCYYDAYVKLLGGSIDGEEWHLDGDQGRTNLQDLLDQFARMLPDVGGGHGQMAAVAQDDESEDEDEDDEDEEEEADEPVPRMPGAW